MVDYWRNNLSTIICVAEAVGNYIITLQLEQPIGEVVIYEIEDGLGSYDSSKETLNVFIKINDPVVIVHGLWDAMAMGREIISELPEKAFSG